MSQAYNLKSIASSSWGQMKNELQLDDSKQKTVKAITRNYRINGFDDNLVIPPGSIPYLLE